MDNHTTFEVERDMGQGADLITVDVDYEFHGDHIPAIKNMSPEEFPELEVLVTYQDKPFTLTPKEWRKLENKLWEEYYDNQRQGF